jgi:hypothetical protein
MVLHLEIDKNIVTFGNDQIKEFLGIYKISNDICDDINKLKESCILVLNKSELNVDGKNNLISFNDKKIYNHIKFYSYIGISIKIKLEKDEKGKYRTYLYYKKKKIHKSYKNFETYFNYKILQQTETDKKYSYLFCQESKLFDENKISVDLGKYKSDERFDMKFIIRDKVSFGLECFEDHHENKNDPNFINETTRLLKKFYYEPDVKFVIIFWWTDLLDENENIFNEKIKIMNSQYDKYNKTLKQYCVDEIFKCIKNKKLSEIIYESHQNVNEPSISVKLINEMFNFKKGKEKKYLNEFISTFKNKNDYLNNDDLVDDDLFDDISESESDISDIESNNKTNKESYVINKSLDISKFYNNDKLSFRGLSHYIIGLSNGDYLSSQEEKFRIKDWYTNLFDSFMSGLYSAYDDLSKIPFEDKIFGFNTI